MGKDVVTTTKPLIATLVLEDAVLLMHNPKSCGREESKNPIYLGEVTFEFGCGVSYIHAEEQVRLPYANTSLSIETTDLNSGESFNQHNRLEDMPEWNPNTRYLERIKYYWVDQEQVDEHFRKWSDYRKRKRE